MVPKRLMLPSEWPALLIAALLFVATPLAAQDDAAIAPTDEPLATGETTETLIVNDEIRALVAPVALYPDPLLAVILQASLFPVDVVQADRFIQRYQEDQTLEPSQDWDPSLYALLNYPSTLAEMNDHLDWTEAMGDAVYDELEAVQDAIQDLRQGAFAMGVLASNDVQEVIVEEGIVQIRPTTEELVAIPEYDGVALLASLEPLADAPAPEATAEEAAIVEEAASGEAAVEGDSDVAEREAAMAQREADLAAREAEVAAREQAASEAAAIDDEVVAEAEYVEPATEYVQSAPVDPYASSYAPAAPTYAQPPVYAAPPPPVAYAQPSSSFWGTAGTFLGGAAVGGLLGYAIFDDDNNNNNNNGGGDNNRRNDINIEDSTIVVGGSGDRLNLDRDTKKRVNQDLRDRRDRADGNNRNRSRSERRDRDAQVAALPSKRRDTGRQRDQSRDISLPQRDRDRPAKVENRNDRSAPALKAPKQKKGAVANVKQPSQTKKDASRGKQSREKAAVKRGQAPQRQLAQRGGGGGKKALGAKKGGKQKAKAKSDRGKKSRGKKRG